jgi:oxaloacetate decarboxylase alpha subunit
MIKNFLLKTVRKIFLPMPYSQKVGIKFFENINNPNYFENAPLDFTHSDGDIYKVTIEDKDYFVKYSKVSDPEILDQKNISNKNNINTDNTSISGEIITAPLSGNIFSIVKNNGESVELDDTVIVLEAMKMETTIKTPLNGIIKKVFVKNGDKVNVGDPLFEVI